ncbi:hypothetical protein Tdes44962_MAKER08216 [Teratosphaeria destructans]|uniref:F-box domain-containing protein n=1 Tax=Teratosphaeria destructans TaxID=418781 RepID=A0A9W7SXR1_9PEZI|nr:hypothetical protein Tdes44962_MAKER08216 [Teratosphaeria destructans]
MDASRVVHKGITRLNALPEEIVANIAFRLDCDDLQNLRLTCRALELSTFHGFADEYFKAKGFILTSDSVNVLLGIANDERLRHRLKHVYLLVAYLPARAIDGHTCGFKPTTRQREAYLMYSSDQQNMKKTRQDVSKISEALGKLPKVTTLTLVDAAERLPAHVDIAGYRKLTRRTATNPIVASLSSAPRDAEYPSFLTHSWRTLLSALSRSGMNTLTGLETLMSHFNGLSACRDLAIPLSERKSSRKTLASLKTLSLHLRSTFVKGEAGSPDLQTSSRQMSHFAKILPAISRLHLTFDGNPHSGFLFSGFMDGLKTPATLTNLSLDTLVINTETLSNVLKACSSLRVFRNVMIELTDESWTTILRVLQKMQDLEHLDLMFLKEAQCKAFFLAQEEPQLDGGDMEPSDFFSFLGYPPGQTLHDGGGGQATEDDDDESSDVETGPPVTDAGPHTSAADMTDAPDEVVSDDGMGSDWQDADGPGAGAAQQEESEPAEAEEDFKAPGLEDSANRGYYVCLKSRDKIIKWLPIFIEQYNLGEAGIPMELPAGVVAGPMPTALAANAGQAAGPNGDLGAQLLHSLISMLPPMPVGNGQGAGGHGAGGQNAGGQVAGGQGAGGQGAGGQGAGGQGAGGQGAGGQGAGGQGAGGPGAAAQNANGQVQAAQSAEGQGTNQNHGAPNSTAGLDVPVLQGSDVGPAAPNPPALPGPAASPDQRDDEDPDAADTSTGPAALIAGPGSGSQTPAQNTTSVQDFAVSGSASMQGAAIVPGGVTIPDPWMFEDEEAVYSDEEVDVD